MPEPREQIQSLIANNQTEDALVLLAKTNGDALLLQAQFNSGKKNFNLGLIDFSEWQRIQARVNYGALEMAGRTPIVIPNVNAGNAQAPVAVPVEQITDKPKVFISYNQKDMFAMRAVKDVLENNDIEVVVDIHNMGVGDNIEVFIEKALRENQFILSIISENSLKSGWVNKELSAALLLSRLGKRWLPILLDKSCFDDDFYDNTLDEFDKIIADMGAKMTQALAKGRDVRPFQDSLARTQDLRNDFGKVIQALRNHLGEDISGQLFDSGMARVVKTIKQ